MFCKAKFKKNEPRLLITYRPGDHEPGEQVPETEEEGHDDCGDLVARSQGDDHHPVHGEVGEAHEDEVVEIEKLLGLPVVPDHRVENQGVHKGLD